MKKNICVAVCLVFLVAPCLADSFEETRRAAEQGNAQAQYTLGVMYGRQGNYTLAYECFLLAAAQGHEQARAGLDYMDLNRIITQEQAIAARRWAQVWTAQKQAQKRALGNP